MSETILVRSPNWIGDQVLSFPFFYFLRQAYPQAKITAVCVPWVSSLQFRGIVDDVIALPRAVRDSAWDRFRTLNQAAREVRMRGPWSLGFALPNSFSSAWLLFRAGVQRRRGYRFEGRSFLLNEAIAWRGDPSHHRAQSYVDLLSPEHRPAQPVKDFFGIPAENDLDDPTPGVVGEFEAERYWGSREVLSPPSEDYWVLAPGATAESRRWPAERYAQLARRIAKETGMRGVIIGGAAEAVMAMQLAEDRSTNLVDWTAKCPVNGLWRVFRNAKFTVCNESGLSHVASLCGSPVHIVCGAANPSRTRPIGPGRVSITLNPVDCWPCERNECHQPAGKHLQCLKGIEVDRVWEEVREAHLK